MSTSHSALRDLGIQAVNSGGSTGTGWWSGRNDGTLLPSINPTTGEQIAGVYPCSLEDYQRIMKESIEAFQVWRMIPAPKRGEVVRLIGQALREKKDQLGTLVSLEVGKIKAEGDGEVQEMIDICDFATGMSRHKALIAVSSGLLRQLTREEAEAVLGHEVAHAANGDMVTLALIQGVVNTFVIFLSRIVGYLVDSFLRRGDSGSSSPGIGYTVTVVVCDIVFGILASIIVATQKAVD
ncbi:MAG TPA: hypothetical protein DDY39_14850, partial [Nitrospira sp.]|nr:hypothetical protein [Nitrospira sp.]